MIAFIHRYTFPIDVKAEVGPYGSITVDIVYGGAFYALVPAQRYGLDINQTGTEKLRHAAGSTTGTHTSNLVHGSQRKQKKFAETKSLGLTCPYKVNCLIISLLHIQMYSSEEYDLRAKIHNYNDCSFRI